MRLTPYALHDGEAVPRIMLDIRQIIPIVEASDYQVRVAKKQRAEREKVSSKDYSKYAVVTHGVRGTALPKRAAMYDYLRALVEAEVALAEIQAAMPTGRWRIVSGTEWTAEGIVADQGLNTERWWVSVPKGVDHPAGPVWRDAKSSALLSNQWGDFFFPALEVLGKHFGGYDSRVEKVPD